MSVQESARIERLAVKMTCAADLLKNISTQITSDLEVSQRKLTRYIRQANLLLSWRKGNAVVRVVGSTVKTVGVVAVVASSLNPRFKIAVSVGEKLWKLGTGLKILSYVANILKEMWQKGCRKSLLDFMSHTTLLVRNVGVLDELVNDVRRSVNSINDTDSHQLKSADQIWNVVSSFIPDTQRGYIHHVICLVLANQNYSPLFDFASLITDPSNDSNVLQLMREVESLRFLEFVQENDSNTLVAIGSFLHVTRELIDFLDSFSKLRESDCVFLQQCLSKFAEESKKINSIVSFLKSLNNIRTELHNVSLTDDRLENNSSTEQMGINNESNNACPLSEDCDDKEEERHLMNEKTNPLTMDVEFNVDGDRPTECIGQSIDQVPMSSAALL